MGLREMLRYAMLRSDILRDYGLCNGRMGMAILFYEYSRLYNDDLYEEYAEELLNTTLVLPASLPLNMQKGLAGIAWGLIYLYERNFIEGDICEILQDVDERLLKGLETNREDILSYFSYRKSVFQNSNTSLSLVCENLDALINTYQDTLFTKNEIIDMIWSNWSICNS